MRQQQVQQALLGDLGGACSDALHLFLLHHVFAEFYEITHHRLHIATNVADFGEF